MGCRRGSDTSLLWLWRRPAATTPIQPLAWESPCTAEAALEMAKRPKKKKSVFVCMNANSVFSFCVMIIKHFYFTLYTFLDF